MISKPSGKKAPSQNPVSYYKGVQQGGVRGKSESVPLQLKGGPQREKISGK